MPTARLVISGAATAAIGVRVARSLYGRWRLMPPADRERIADLAADAKEKAFVARGADDLERAAADLRAANHTLAAALVEAAEADPELDAAEVHELRQELRRELDRLAVAQSPEPATPSY